MCLCRISAYQALPAAFIHIKPNCNSGHLPKGGAVLLQCTSSLFKERLSWKQQGGGRVGPIKRNYTTRGKLTVFIWKKRNVNWGLSGIANHCPNRQQWDLEEKRQGRLGEPLHPTLPVCRIPMKKDNMQAAYQSILSFPHISLTTAQTAKPDRWERSWKAMFKSYFSHFHSAGVRIFNDKTFNSL